MAWFVKWFAPYVSPAVTRLPHEHDRYQRMRAHNSDGLTLDPPNGRKLDPGRQTWDWSSPTYMLTGFRLPPYDEPLRDLITTRPKQMKDIVCSSFGYAVSDKARHVFETLEPEVHQFLPFEFVDRKGVPTPERRWLLNICNRLDTIDVERSGSNIVEGPNGKIWVKSGPRAIVMDKTRIAGRHLWYEWRFLYAGVVVSDTLWASLKKAKISGWNNYGDHVPEI